MLATVRNLALAVGCSMALSPFLAAQTGALEGTVTGEDGQPVKGALIRIERLDVKGNYKVKTKKKGTYFHAGLPMGQYKVMCEMDGKVLSTVNGVRVSLGSPTEVDFDLLDEKRKRDALQAAARAGTLSAEQTRGMTSEQKKALEKQMAERSKAMKKNKDLNDSFNAGMQAKNTKQWDVAIESFEKASQVDPEQTVVWAHLADSYVQKARTIKGEGNAPFIEKGLAAYQQLITLKPDEANYYNNYALALYSAGRNDEGQGALEKAIALNPGGAGQYYYNLGASLVNIDMVKNQAAACGAFAQAVEADAAYAPAQFQHGNCLMYQMKMSPEGKPIPAPGTLEAFQKYLELDPSGPFAAQAQQMLSVVEMSVETEYVNPDSEKRKRKKK